MFGWIARKQFTFIEAFSLCVAVNLAWQAQYIEYLLLIAVTAVVGAALDPFSGVGA